VPPANAQLANGGFETPPNVYPYMVFGAGLSLPGWTMESGTVEIVGTYWQAAEGRQSLDLNGIFEEIGTLYQDVATVPGARYRVRFALAGNPEGGPAVKSLTLTWGDSELDTLTFDTTGRTLADMGWEYHEYVVTAASTRSRLRFQSTSSSFCGPALDDISVTPLDSRPPPPASPVPVIHSFAPHGGPPGEAVHIVGTNFAPTVEQNQVYFGSVKALVQSASDRRLAVLVPTGALFAPITLTVNGLTAYGDTPFSPTFSGNRLLDASTFAPRVTFATGRDPTTFAIGDLDGDGQPDLAVANYQSHTLSVFRNTSQPGRIDAGSFQTAVDFPAGPCPASVALGDLDGDGRLDVVVANDYGANISVYRNTSSPGAFTASSLAPRVNFDAGTHPVSVAVGDLDRDGRPDIAVANAAHAPSTVGVFRNTGAVAGITAATFEPMVEFPVGSYVFKVTIGDLDADGRPELAAANIESSSVSVLRNLSTRGIIASDSFAPHVDFDTGGRTFDLTIGDLDGDGVVDLAAVGDGGVSLFRNKGDGRFNAASFETRVALPVEGTAYEIKLADLGGDAKPDLAVTILYQNGVSVYENRSVAGALRAAAFGPKYDYAGAGNSVAVADLDGDTRPDLVTCLSSVVSVYRNVGGGSPPPPPPPPPGTMNTFGNGGFESPQGIYPYMVFTPGRQLPGWVVESGTVEIVGPYWQAAEGVQSLDLNGIFEDIGTIYQDVATTAGERYRIRFASAGNPECGPAVKSIKVFWDAEELAALEFDTTERSVTNMGWEYHEYVVTAAGARSRLRFQSTSSSFCGPALDDVSVSLLTTNGESVALAPAAFPPPVTALAMDPQPRLTIYGNVGRVYRIECSPEPLGATWQEITTVVLPTSPYTWTDPATNAPRKFYRAVLVH